MGSMQTLKRFWTPCVFGLGWWEEAVLWEGSIKRMTVKLFLSAIQMPGILIFFSRRAQPKTIHG